MPIVQPWKPGDPYKCLVFGRFKSYKTAGAGTFPRPNFIDFDRGTATLGAAWWRTKYGPRQVMAEQFWESKLAKGGFVASPHAFDDATRYFDACMSKATVKWKHPVTGVVTDVNSDMFDTWVLDSATVASELGLNKAVWLLGLKEFKGQRSETHAEALKYGAVIPRIQDWTAERSMVEQLIEMLNTSGKNVVIICHEKEISNDNGTVTDIVPLLTGKSVESVCLKFDEVYRATVKRLGVESIPTLTTRPNGIVKVGTRYGLPDGTAWNYQAITDALTTINKEIATP